ncbi:Cellobiose dehydrogenase [Phytophthora cinnamomi]|uniref:Cellobiose dehydrogenase n=1 Tax=Phytophthora cinnamomi TaxID=4785 RepID=UPI003559C0F8|nr:Cellobiose dehydrogenase [Phytophthora cinnamomi]
MRGFARLGRLRGAGLGGGDVLRELAAGRRVNGCNAFTWTDDNRGTCWLKSGEGTSKSTVGAISGVVQA